MPPNAPLLYKLMRSGGRSITSLVRRGIEFTTKGWLKPVYELRKELRLPPGGHPLFDGQFSPELNLALFSNAMYVRPSDIPSNTIITGFPFCDEGSAGSLDPKLARFLESGPAPIVFTLGSSAVHIAGDFFRTSLEAARIADERAVFLVGDRGRLLNEQLPDGMIATAYAPHGELMPKASVVIHQGGVGTTGQALRAGVPMIVVPYNHDQHDNAARVEKLGVGRTIYRTEYEGPCVAAWIRELLDQPDYQRRATVIGQRVRAENGAVLAVESILRTIKGGKKNNKGEMRSAAALG